MILAHGELLENSAQAEVIAALPADICKTLAGSPLSPSEVIAACDRLSRRAQEGEFDRIALPLLQLLQIDYDTYLHYCTMFSAAELQKKVSVELGDCFGGEVQVSEHLFRERRPLGVLLHIAAGNVDALPAYSVMEGLLAGNINLLKLPTGDSGVSVLLLSELIRECPQLKDYIYVFDVPSTEIETIKQLAALSDGVAVWGGDVAVRAAHQFISPNTKLIVWGHKLSFAYVSLDCTDRMLESLALEICRTNQMLCSSPQGIYVDTSDPAALSAFARRFFEILRSVNLRVGKAPRGMRGKNSLKLYTDRLEGNGEILAGDGVSVVVRNGTDLELSYLFRNAWVKALPRRDILAALKPQKGYLQSCALLMPLGSPRSEALELLKRAGLTRITDERMSSLLLGESHDGLFPLWEYSRFVDIYR